MTGKTGHVCPVFDFSKAVWVSYNVTNSAGGGESVLVPVKFDSAFTFVFSRCCGLFLDVEKVGNRQRQSRPSRKQVSRCSGNGAQKASCASHSRSSAAATIPRSWWWPVYCCSRAAGHWKGCFPYQCSTTSGWHERFARGDRSVLLRENDRLPGRECRWRATEAYGHQALMTKK